MHQVWRDRFIIVPQTAHGSTIWHLLTPDEGVQRDRGSTNNLCGVLPQGVAVGEIPGAGLPSGST